MKKPCNIQILTEFEHPVGLQYIYELLKRKIKIGQIFFTQNRRYPQILKQFRKRMGRDFVMAKAADLLKNTNIPCYFLADINSRASISSINSFSPDLIIIAAVGIVKKDLLKIPRIGILNCHPGILPKYRGCTCVEWALYNNEPVGCTCHFISEKIDWGDVAARETLPIKRGDSYNDVRRKSLYHCASVLGESVEAVIRNKNAFAVIKLDEQKKQYFRPIDNRRLAVVKDRLKKKKYAHYID